ncbi:MAG: hypothetical protein P9L99_10645 [Candidatus Lernaella stagnicola]|nr:hypothetical protein [Candidatus Lernaella stagnicola]
MLPRRILVILLCVLFAAVACQRAKKEDMPATAVVEKLGPSAEVEHYTALVTARRNPPIDFAKMTDIYDNHLKTYVKAADQRYGTKLAAAAEAAMQAGLAGDDPAVNGQTAEKSIQRAFILTFLRSLQDLQNDGSDRAAYTRVVAASWAVDSVADRRSQWVGKGRDFPDAFQRGLVELFAAVNDNAAARVSEAAGNVADFADRMLLLSVLYELKGLSDARGTDEGKAAEKIVEARIYYQSLQPDHQQRNKKGAATVSAQLAGDPADVDVGLVRTILRNDYLLELSGINPTLFGG